jgi:hypothetical protein
MKEWMYRSCLLDLGISWRWVVSFPPRLPYPREGVPRTHRTGGWVGPRASLDDVENRTFFTLLGLELRPLVRPVRSQSLYQQHYPGYWKIQFKFWTAQQGLKQPVEVRDTILHVRFKTGWHWNNPFPFLKIIFVLQFLVRLDGTRESSIA